MIKKIVWPVCLSLVGVISCVSQNKVPERNVAGIRDIIKEWNANSNLAQDFSGQTTARPLTTKDILKHTSTGKLAATSAELIIDNDAAFDAKLQAIRSAKQSIRMSYYIYADDDSSSVITSELIKKAQEGVKVKLLVDFISTYPKLDLFQMMVNEGRGNLEVRFYNFPTERIQADAKYMSLPCPKTENPSHNTCVKYKNDIMAKTANNPNPFFAKMFLAGLYGRNPIALKGAVGLGAQINPEDYKSTAGETSPEDQARLLEFLKLYFDAKVKGDIGAMIKVTIAMFIHGDDLNPIVNEISGRLPLENKTKVAGTKLTHAQEWDHITDYSHHKLLAVDGRYFILGGRNIEDSYHMKSRLGTKGKYIFMDTDFSVTTSAGGAAAVDQSFDKIFNFTPMVATLDKVQRIVPIDMVNNNELLGATIVECTTQAKTGKIQEDQVSSCVETAFSAKVKSTVSARLNKVKQEMLASAQKYNSLYAAGGKKILRDNWRNKSFTVDVNKLSTEDLQTADIYYVENTSFNLKEDREKQLVRRAGSKIGAEKFFNKNIHALWYRGIENACYVSAKEKRDVRVVFHSAYLFMPSGLVHKMAKMLNGDYGDCSRVHLTLLTNSIETTDLNVINVFARYQLTQLFRHYQALVMNTEQNKRWFPKVDYYEYNATGVGTGISLHTKLSLLGDDMIVGSANADTRSYSMDTNNAVFIRNARNMNRDYATFVDGLMADKNKTTEYTMKYSQITDDQIKQENEYILGQFICRWDKTANCAGAKMIKASQISSKRFSKERIAEALQLMDQIGARISHANYKILNFRGEFDEIENFYRGRDYNSNYDAQLEGEFNKLANEFDNWFKVL